MNPRITKDDLTEAEYETLLDRVRRSGYGELLERVCKENNVGVRDVFESRRFKPHVVARARFFAELRAKGLSYPHIGWLAGRDHSTVMDAIQSYGVKRAAPRKPARMGAVG